VFGVAHSARFCHRRHAICFALGVAALCQLPPFVLCSLFVAFPSLRRLVAPPVSLLAPLTFAVPLDPALCLVQFSIPRRLLNADLLLEERERERGGRGQDWRRGRVETAVNDDDSNAVCAHQGKPVSNEFFPLACFFLVCFLPSCSLFLGV
jgi:hypothetical protein